MCLRAVAYHIAAQKRGQQRGHLEGYQTLALLAPVHAGPSTESSWLGCALAEDFCQ